VISRSRVKVGDVFMMTVTNERVSFGQVMANIKPNPPLFGIFEPLFERELRPPLEEITKCPLLFLVNSFDVKIANGDWPIVGWKEPSIRETPNFKLGSGEHTMVISYDGTRRRLATPEEALTLELRNSVSPALLLRAVRAYHGYEVWEPDFDRYRYEKALRSLRVKV